jgi:hypothetical protein
MNERKVLRRMARLGIADFETLADVERQQKKFIRNLGTSSITRNRYAGFEGCNETICGRHRCSEVCRFAAYDRRIKHIAAAHSLLTQCDDPIFEIRVSRGCWVQPVDELNKVSVGAARQLNRRALDSLYNPDLVAIGAFKVCPANLFNAGLWVAEIHELITGGEMDIEDIKAAFTPAALPPGGTPEYADLIWVKKVENVGQALSSMFDYRLRPWRDPREVAGTQQVFGKKSPEYTSTKATFRPARLTMDLWEEYYDWRLALPANICLIRYGCDRHFNKLAKEPRLIREPKKRPYPEWLVPFMFGNRDVE